MFILKAKFAWFCYAYISIYKYVFGGIIHFPNKTPKDIFCQVSYEPKELAGRGSVALPFAATTILAGAYYRKRFGERAFAHVF